MWDSVVILIFGISFGAFMGAVGALTVLKGLVRDFDELMTKK